MLTQNFGKGGVDWKYSGELRSLNDKGKFQVGTKGIRIYSRLLRGEVVGIDGMNSCVLYKCAFISLKNRILLSDGGKDR